MSKSSRCYVLAGLMLAGTSFSSFHPARSQDAAPNPSEVIEGRRQNFKDLGGAFKNIGDELKKPNPMMFLVKQYASQIDDFAHEFEKSGDKWFPKGSGPEAGVKTQAKAEIWAKPQEWEAARQAFFKEVPKFVDVADKGDANALKAESKALGETCQNCHKPFREKEE